MDVFDVLLQAGLFTALVVLYLIFIRKHTAFRKNYRESGWNYPLKLLLAKYAVKRWRTQLPKTELKETPNVEQSEGWDAINVKASAPNGCTLLLGIRKQCGRKSIAEVTVYVKLADGTSYRLPQHPETAVSAWSSVEGGWSAGGLKIQVLEEQQRLRILYNGLLTRDDGVTQHVTLNLLWASATSVVRHPEDWSEQLAAQTLALEPWRDNSWPLMLNKCDEGSGSWIQWGAVQGRFQSYDEEGGPDRSEYLRVRGVRARHWAAGCGPRRSVTLTASTPDGTAVQINANSYKKDFTQCVSGSVRFPNYKVKSICDTDLILSDFCESAEEIPKTYTINVSAMNRSIKLVVRVHETGGRLLHGFPHQQEVVFRTVSVEIDGEHGTGILELGYESVDRLEPQVRIEPLPSLAWLNEAEVGEIGYCLSFEDRAAACCNYVGGKGASLALLASVQKEQGYRVPPGFCLTIRALNKHLEVNPELKRAISDIEGANEDYIETNFKEKCTKAAALFMATDIEGDIKQEILDYLTQLRRKASEDKLGPDLRFAVRSSAVGEDSEALSAAGQNETVLGCVRDDDVLRGIAKCWASMFAFTSAYYRRQNGLECLCGGGVVVQALAAARAAGVLFTRTPAGDPARLLVTANYGLGESVVSGSVEPDTIIVNRGLNGKLEIAKIDIGSKTRRVTASGEGVNFEDVPDSERTKPCLSLDEILKLAEIGVAQEELWGSGRDIEWAINNDSIFLLQARPITSLERWTEEELLHELDFPIMSDDELVTFANVGEVMPKPLSALSHDLVFCALEKGMDTLMEVNGDGYDKSTIITHNRGAIALYNTVYRKVREKVDVSIRMIEMAIHGHKVADDSIISIAAQRRKPRFRDSIDGLIDMVKVLLISKRTMDKIIRAVNIFNVDKTGEDPLTLLDAICATEQNMRDFLHYHGVTTTASTFTNFLAMTIFLEGRSDFTPEECTEVSTLLSSGDVLSAEVPQVIAKISRMIEKSGKLEEFRGLDPKFAMSWLKYNLSQVHREVTDFLETHGHRAVMEFDLATKPWVLAPDEFMSLLMHVRPTKDENHHVRNNDEVIASLKTPQKSSTRKVLRWIMPLCHSTVRHREASKAALVLAIHRLRLAARYLGRRLVTSWHLPSLDLVFHFRVTELRRYILTRDPALLKKAIQRQQYHPKWAKLKFAEINKGWTEPMKSEGLRVTSGDIKIKATSVCGGEVIARACVVKDLTEIGQLQEGDILITHSTDIGWSPYFPLLSGIVTELGGIISHGAVIAREYGLPCIVGACSATDVFSTGDTVRLSGICGVVEKVSLPDK